MLHFKFRNEKKENRTLTHLIIFFIVLIIMFLICNIPPLAAIIIGLSIPSSNRSYKTMGVISIIVGMLPFLFSVLVLVLCCSLVFFILFALYYNFLNFENFKKLTENNNGDTTQQNNNKTLERSSYNLILPHSMYNRTSPATVPRVPICNSVRILAVGTSCQL